MIGGVSGVAKGIANKSLSDWQNTNPFFKFPSKSLIGKTA